MRRTKPRRRLEPGERSLSAWRGRWCTQTQWRVGPRPRPGPPWGAAPAPARRRGGAAAPLVAPPWLSVSAVTAAGAVQRSARDSLARTTVTVLPFAHGTTPPRPWPRTRGGAASGSEVAKAIWRGFGRAGVAVHRDHSRMFPPV